MLKKLLYMFLVICTMRACGTAGGLDTKFFNPMGSFGGAPNLPGLITTDFVVGSFDVARAVAIQADGRIVVAGFTRSGAFTDFALARYNTDGNLDSTFGIGGKVTTDFGGFNDIALAVSLQTDGRIVAVGQSDVAGPTDFALARYNTDGSLDLTFNGTGKVTTDFGSVDFGRAIALQADGKIIAVGQSGNGLTDDFALARYNTDGSLDTSFGTGGLVTTNFGLTSKDGANAVAIQTDGKIVAVGQSNVAGTDDFALVRYNIDGSLDTTSFNPGGTLSPGIAGLRTTNFGGTTDFARAVVIQTDGKIVAVGQSGVDGATDFALARYNTDGSPDLSFNGTSMVTTDFGGPDDVVFAVSLQADGKIVAIGLSNATSFFVFALARYNADGSLDNSFDGDGKVTTSFGGDSAQALAGALQADGKILAVGFNSVAGNADFALARYLANVPSISTTLTWVRIV